jgi:hypothetical protein
MNRHALRLTPFVAGLLFVTLAVLFGLDAAGETDLDLRWIPAVVLIGLGAATVLGPLTRRAPDRAAPVRRSPDSSDHDVDNLDTVENVESVESVENVVDVSDVEVS